MTIWFYSKSKDFDWLSNFAASPFVLDGIRWPTVEHYYQAQKYADPDVKNRIRNAESAAAARKAGGSRSIVVRDDWEQVKEDVMRTAVNAKFQQNHALRERLLETEGAELVHQSSSDHSWGRTTEGEGENRLGEILMELRRQLQDGGV